MRQKKAVGCIEVDTVNFARAIARIRNRRRLTFRLELKRGDQQAWQAREVTGIQGQEGVAVLDGLGRDPQVVVAGPG